MSKRTSIRDQAVGIAKSIGRLAFPAMSMVSLAFLWFFAGGVVIMHGESGSGGAAGTVVGLYKEATRFIYLNLESAVADDPLFDLWRRSSELIQSPDAVVRHDAGRSYDGLTLVVTAGAATAELMNMRGEVVHSWALPFREAFEDHPRRDSIDEDDVFHWRRVRLYPNGDILAVYESPYLTPYGFGLVKLDRNSRPIWANSGNFHHDADIGPDGRIYALRMEVSTLSYSEFDRMSAPYIAEYITVLSPEGDIEKEISIIEAFRKSIYNSAIHRMSFSSTKGDYIHSNSIEYITAEQARMVPFLASGQLLISLREMDMIAILDVEQEEIVWAMSGMWRRQHEAQVLPNGNFMIFDNLGNTGPGGDTRILEFDPATQQVAWSYAGTEEEPLSSSILGTQQRLPNGNTLIVDSRSARIIEVTTDGEIVWEYESRGRRTIDGREFTPVIADAARFAPETLTFLDSRAASSGEPAGPVVVTP